MRLNAFFPSAAVGVVLVGLASTAAFADVQIGTFKLTSQQGSSQVQVKVWVESAGTDGRTFTVCRQEVYSDGSKGTALRGTGTLQSSGWIRVSFASAVGLTDLPLFNGGTQPQPGDYRGTYKVDQNGQRIRGYYRGPDRRGRLINVYERGTKAADEASPGSGGGSTPGGNTTAGGVADLQAQVVGVQVLNGITISDVSGDRVYERALGAQAATKQEPAAILKNRPLNVRVFIAGRNNPAQPVRATLTGTAGGKTLFSQQVQLTSVTGSGQSVELTSSEPISNAVKINELDVQWKLDTTAIGGTPLRVYTIHAQPVKNISNDRTEVVTKRHLESACRWANGATRNIGQGADSIPYQLDNQMRHYVHTSELGNAKPVVPDYAPNAAKPVNYDDLEGYVSNGVRSVSSLYYPPLEVTKPYEEYANFRNNFGWYLLDNPTHVGGRCNQQASLVCAIVGTVGMKGKVHYLERTGRGKTTGRPVRQYFFAQGGGGPWNFHGVALIDLDDGSQWIYDGSFSFPPNRKNGTKQWAENAGGPFVGSWADWYYEDFGGKVPANDRPDTWQGVQ